MAALAAALGLGLALPWLRRPADAIGALALQGWMLAALAVWSGLGTGAAGLLAAAPVIAAVQGTAVPALLLRRADRDVALGEAPAGAGLLAAALLALAVLILPPRGEPVFPAALGLVLLALLRTVAAREDGGRAIGLASMQNGAVLAGFGAPGAATPLLAALASGAVAALVLAGLARPSSGESGA